MKSFSHQFYDDQQFKINRRSLFLIWCAIQNKLILTNLTGTFLASLLITMVSSTSSLIPRQNKEKTDIKTHKDIKNDKIICYQQKTEQ